MNLLSARRVLVCLRYGIGDLVMQTPALNILRRALPTAYVAALGARPAIELLENDPRVDALVCTQDWGVSHWGDAGTPEIKRAIRDWLRQQDFDVILDPYHAVIAVQHVLWEQPITIFDTGKQAQNDALKDHAGGTAAAHAATLRAWGLGPTDEPRPRLCLKAADLRFAERFLADHGFRSEPPVAISPVASSPLKRWPIERLAAVADRIIEERHRRLLLFHGPQSEGVTELLDHVRHADQIALVGSINLRRVAAILARCATLIGNDTGLMHIAAAVGVSVVAVFGPTSPTIYLPPKAMAIPANIDCPYRRTMEFGPPECVVVGRCLIGDESCINQVSVDEVVGAVKAVLDLSAGPQWEAGARASAQV